MNAVRKPIPGDTIHYFDGKNAEAAPYPGHVMSVLDSSDNPEVTFVPLGHKNVAGPVRLGQQGDTTPHYRWPTQAAPTGPAPRVGVYVGS